MAIPAPLPVRSAQGDYVVHFAPSVEDAVAATLADPPSAIVVDRRVAGLHAAALAPLLAARPTLQLDATEETKTLQGVEQVARFFQDAGMDRKSRVLAIGGGIIQDLVTFTAHGYYRGVAWTFLPTTLLAMSDSCIGAKCGINLGAFKNQLGVFQSPAGVTIAPAFLDTLDERDVASGHGEILKLMLTGSAEAFGRYEAALAEGGLRTTRLADLVRESLDVKRGVIEEDEYETGLRQILNYGHTFGHALEAATDHAVPHGLAVAWGIDVINFLAVRRGWLDPAWAARVRTLIAGHLTCPVPGVLDVEALMKAVRRDKKAAAGSITLAIMAEPGRLTRHTVPLDAALTADLQAYLAEADVFPRG